DPVDRQHLEGGAGADDVDDGVDGTHLVEVDLAGVAAVQPALHVGQGGEGGQGAVAHPVGQPGLLDEAHDVGVGAHDGRVLGAHVHAGGGDPAPLDGPG